MADASQNQGEQPAPPHPYGHPYPYGYPAYGYPPIPPAQPNLSAGQRPSPYAAADPWAQPGPPYSYTPAPSGYPPPYGQQPPLPPPGYPSPYGQQQDPRHDREPMPDNGLILAIVAVFASCACGFLGLIPAFVAVVQANKVTTLWSAGQRDLAREAAKSAKTWSLVAFGLIGFSWLIALVSIAAGGGS